MTAYEKRIWGIVPLGLAGLSFLFFQFCYPYHLFLKEQIQLFIYTSDYFFSYFQKPAWLACYLGDFLTQFFYLRGGGALVLSSVLVFEWWLCSVVLGRISSSAKVPFWALFPVVADWILQCDILHGLSFSLGFLFTLSLFLIYTSIRNRRVAFISGVTMALAGYWLAGSSFLIFPLLIWVWDLKNNRTNWLCSALVATIVFSAPLVMRHHFLLTALQAYIFPAFHIQSLFLPATILLVLGLAPFLKKFEVSYSKTADVVIPLIFILLLITGIKANANFDFEKILSLDSETYFGNTDRVIELAKKQRLENRQATYFVNMALAKRGELPEHLLEFYQPSVNGLLLPALPTENWQSIFVSNEAFFLMGDMNMAQHSAMLGNTFSPYQRSSRMIRRLAEINLVNNDSAAANKYLQILNKTWFHKKWAQSRLAMNRDSVPGKWLNEKRSQIPKTDRLLESTNYLESLNFLVEQQPNNLFALDYLLCYHLLNKDLKSFRKVYDRYGKMINRTVPSLYSEALLIQLFTAEASQEEIFGYGIDLMKIKDFTGYTQLCENPEGNKNTLKDRFGKSYWFYYHFATIQKK